MKKLIFTMFCLSLACFCTYGKTVDVATLRNYGYNFLQSQGVEHLKSSNDLVQGYLQDGICVFKITSGKGWIMLASDDRVKPVLAWSDHSDFDFNNMAPATKAWIENYEEQIKYAISNKIKATPTIVDEWKNLAKSTNKTAARTTATRVGPLMATTWDQGWPYNDLCPLITTTSGSYNAVTGCVATAMAQIMKYWNWPTVGCGFHTYLDTPFGMLSANFGATAYKWTDMQLAPFGSDSAMALLMYQAGVSVNMEYNFLGAGVSNALTNTRQSFITPCSEFALKANFHYKRSLYSLYRFGTVPGLIEGTGPDSINEATWIAKMKAEMDAHRPIMYNGYNFINGSGHEWIMDGYTVSDYFHFNWGWGGGSNGYFTLNNLNPASISFNLNYNQVALMGIEPDSFPSNQGNIKLQSWLTTTNTPATFGKPFSITTKIGNDNTTAFSGDFCAQVFDTSNNPIGTIQTISGQTIAAGGSTPNLTFSTTGMYNLVTGIYGVRILYRNTGDIDWTPIANNNTYINYTNVAFYNDTDIEIVAPIAITTGANLVRNQPFSFTAIISNWAFAKGGNNLYWAHDNFNGNLKATLNSITDGSEQFVIQQLNSQRLDSNHIDTFTFSTSSLSVPSGYYLLEIQHQYGGTGNYYLTGSTFECNPMMVNVVNVAATPQVTKSGEISVYPNPATSELTISSSEKITSLSITNTMGQIVREGHYNQLQIVVPLANMASGVYFAKINGTLVKKFIKE